MNPNAPNKPDGHLGFDRSVFADLTGDQHAQNQRVEYDDSHPDGLVVYIGEHQGIWMPYEIEQAPTAHAENIEPVDLVAFQQALNNIEPVTGTPIQPRQPVTPLQVPQVPPPNRVPKRTRQHSEEDELEAQAPSRKRLLSRNPRVPPYGQRPVNPMPHINQSSQGRNGNPQGHHFRPAVQDEFAANSRHGFWNPPMTMGNSYPVVNNMGHDPRFVGQFPTNQPPPGAFMPNAYTIPANGTHRFPAATQANHVPRVPFNHGPHYVNAAGPQGQSHALHYPTQQVVPNEAHMRRLAPRMGPQMTGQVPCMNGGHMSPSNGGPQMTGQVRYVNGGHLPPSNGIPQRMHPMVQMHATQMRATQIHAPRVPAGRMPESHSPETNMSESSGESV